MSELEATEQTPGAGAATPEVAPNAATPPSADSRSTLSSLLTGKILPVSIGIAMVVGLTVLAMRLLAAGGLHLLGASPSRDIVVVDISRIVNAQRAAIDRDPGDGRLVTMRAGKISEEVIRRIAGPDALVLVKQAVVSAETGSMRDITDDVLKELDLPLDAANTMSIPQLVVPAASLTEQGHQIEEMEAKKNKQATSEWAQMKEREAKKDTLVP